MEGGILIKWLGTVVSPMGMPITVPMTMASRRPDFIFLEVKARMSSRVIPARMISGLCKSPSFKKPESLMRISLTLDMPVAVINIPTAAPMVILSPFGMTFTTISRMLQTLMMTKMTPEIKFIPSATCQVVMPAPTME